MAPFIIFVDTAACPGGRSVEPITASARSLRKNDGGIGRVRVVSVLASGVENLGRTGNDRVDLVGPWSIHSCIGGTLFPMAPTDKTLQIEQAPCHYLICISHEIF